MTDLTTRAFGIELEIIRPRGLTFEGVADAIRATGAHCAAETYNHLTRPHWKVVSDGSLPSTGAEVVSPKLYGEEGLAEACRVVAALRDARCRVTVQCGFHLHVDAAGMSPAEVARIATNYVWFETFFDHVMPASRRGSHNTYVKSNRSAFGGYGTSAVNTGLAAIAANGASLNALVATVNRHDRYYKLNLTPISRQGSIEFRQHSGTVEPEKVEQWVRLMMAFVEKSRVSRPRARTVTRDLTAAEEMHRFFAMFPVPTETRAFYMLRRRQIAKQDRTARQALAAIAANPTAYARDVLARLESRLQHIQGYARRQPRLEARFSQAINMMAHASSGAPGWSAQAISREVETFVRNRLLPRSGASQ